MTLVAVIVICATTYAVSKNFLEAIKIANGYKNVGGKYVPYSDTIGFQSKLKEKK